MKVLGGDGSAWLRDIQEDEMSFDHKPINPSRGVSRSGRTSGFDHTYRHPSDGPDMHPFLWALIPLFLVGLWVVAL